MATIATVESTALARIETIAAIDLFRPEVIDPIIASIREQVIARAATLDISTPGNRADLASLAYKVGRSKTFIDGQRKALVSDEKKRLAKIDAEGKRIWESLEALQHEVRKPLTDWEDAEESRVASHKQALSEVEAAGPYTLHMWSSLTAEAIRDRMSEIEGDARDYQEFAVRHAGVKALALKQLGDALAKRETYDAEQAELARLRADNAAREQKEREERIAREATEKAEREAKEREERAARESNERESQAQREKEAAEARALKAEADAKEAAERAERDRLSAVAAERKRVEDARLAEEAAQKVREKDKAYKAEVNDAALSAIIAIGVSEADAKKVITAIAKGQIPNVKVVY